MSPFVHPVWSEEGPGPLALDMAGFSLAAGAVQAVATDPVDPDRVFIATVGGGIWGSTDAATAASPIWQPLTDQQPSLSMSAIAISPTDPARNTLYAGCGATSHSNPVAGVAHGPLLGLLKSTDGGAHWTELARSTFEGSTVTRILATSQAYSPGEVILVSTIGAGLQRSTTGGQTWQHITDVKSNNVSDVTADPSNPLRVYVATVTGVFRSDDGGNANWTNITAGLVKPAGSTTIKLSVAPTADLNRVHRLYAVLSKRLAGVALYYTPDYGVTWVNMGLPPDGSLPAPAMVASPSRSDVVFCGTDNGTHWMIVAGTGAAAATWSQVDLAGANNTAPHTDARDAAFSADHDLMFETNDGGIYRLRNPHGPTATATRQWEPAVGNLRVTEFHAIAYDSVHRILFGATQDNSIPQQTTPGGFNWGINEETWGDGFAVGVDNTSVPGTSIHSSTQQHLFYARRRTYTSPLTVTADVGITFIVNGTGGLGYNQVEGALTEDGSLGTVRPNQDWVLNAADPTRLLLGTDYLYESFDRGDHIESLGGLIKNANDHWMPINPVGTVSAYAYGHAANHDVIYLGAGGNLLVRESGTGLPVVVASYPGTTPIGIAMAPDNWRHAYVLDDSGQVWRTLDAGGTAGGWSDLTGNLPALTPDLRCIAVPDSTAYGMPRVILLGGSGGVYATTNPGPGHLAFWRKHGTNLPNAVVTDMQYTRADDSLVVGTLGRSAWSLPQMSNSFSGAPIVTIHAMGESSCVGGLVEGSTVTFKATVTDLSLLTAPVWFEWHVYGSPNVLPQPIPTQITAVVPAAGQEIDVTVVVTDNAGYRIFGAHVDQSVTAQVAGWRQAFCALIARLRTELIYQWPINPLGPDVRRIDTIPSRPTYGPVLQTVRELGAVLERLGEADRAGAPQAREPSYVRERAAWARAYPQQKAAAEAIPIRTDLADERDGVDRG